MRSVFNITPSWEVSLYRQDGIPAAIFDAFESFTINKKLNDIGTFSITFKDNGDDRLGSDYWQIDGQVSFRRDLPYYTPEFGNAYFANTEMLGLLRKVTKSTSSSGEKLITYEGFSCEHLLARRVIAALEGTIRADKNAPADWVMCEYVNENCGEAATAAAGRQFVAVDGTADTDPIIIDAPGVMPGFVVDFPNGGGDAPVWTGSRSMENLLEVLQDIAKSYRVDFMVDYINGPIFMFSTHPEYGIGHNRTWDGLDPTTGLNRFNNRPIVFSIRTETVVDMEATLDRMAEGNFVFILGKGDMSTRNVYPEGNLLDIPISPWNQIEVVRSGSDQDFLYQLKDAAREALAELAYKETIKFTPYQVPKALYGEHYFLGDLVTVDHEFFSATQRIIGVNFTYDTSGEHIELELENPAMYTEAALPAQPAGHTEFFPVAQSASLSPSASVSPSASRSLSPSASPSPSASVSRSVSRSLSPSASASRSVSRSLSPSGSASASPSPSAGVASASPSLSPSHSVSPSVSRSVSRSASRSLSPSASTSRSPSPSSPPLDFNGFSTTTGSGTLSWSHASAGTTFGVLVLIMQGGSGADRITSVTYDGNALTRVDFKAKTSGEAGAVYAYFLGSGIPLGTPKTVVVNTSAAGSYHAACITFIASANTVVQDTCSTSSDFVGNPVCTLTTGGSDVAAVVGFMSGNTVTVSPRSSWTSRSEVNWSTYSTGYYSYDLIEDSDVTAGVVQPANDIVMVAVAVREV